MPHKSLKFLSPHPVVHWSLKARVDMLSGPQEEGAWSFHVSGNSNYA